MKEADEENEGINGISDAMIRQKKVAEDCMSRL